jgi:hypothetical protein
VSAAGKSGPARSYWAEIGLLFGLWHGPTARTGFQREKERLETHLLAQFLNFFYFFYFPLELKFSYGVSP